VPHCEGEEGWLVFSRRGWGKGRRAYDEMAMGRVRDQIYDEAVIGALEHAKGVVSEAEIAHYVEGEIIA